MLSPVFLDQLKISLRIPWASATSIVHSYLAVVEAEVQASIGNQEACFLALGDAEEALDHADPHENSHWIRFDYSRLAGYQGACFQKLYRPDERQTTRFLSEAQKVLTSALDQLSPTRIQRRPVLLLDLAGTNTKQEEIEAACEHAIEAITIINQTKSQIAFQRLLKLRHELSPWQKSQHVKNLDSHMALLAGLA